MMMHLRGIRLSLLLLGALSCVAATHMARGRDALSRKKRFVAFPEGSSVSAAICMTIGVIGNPNVAYLSWAENWGVAYNLPNYTWVKEHAHGFQSDVKMSQAVVQRRSRRDLYEKVESLMEGMGFKGRACIKRALCESSKYWSNENRGRGTMLEEIIKTVFSFPRDFVQPHEPAVMHQYDGVYRRGKRDTIDCARVYADCQFSLLELAFGKYTVPPTKHGPSAKALQALKFM